MDKHITVIEYLKNNKLLYLKNKNRFYDLFGCTLTTFFDIRFGFDIVKFDLEVIKTPDNESMEDCVRKRYGEGAAMLINILIG